MQKRTSVSTSKVSDSEIKYLLGRIERHVRDKYRDLRDVEDLLAYLTPCVTDALTRFDPEYPRANLEAWVFGWVKRSIRTYFKGRKPPPVSFDEEGSLDEIADSLAHVELMGLDAETKAMVWRHINTLPKQTRAIFVNYYAGDYSAQELADAYGCTRSNIYALMAKTRKMLKERLTGEKKVVRWGDGHRKTY
jgi:RNA polymerase sigma factor (sigma-70 family)